MRLNTTLLTDQRVQKVQGPVLPEWARSLFDGSDRQSARRGRLQGVWSVAGEWSWIQVVCPGAAGLSDLEFQEQVITAYTWIQEIIGDLSARHPVRMWNFVPDICRPVAGGWDRYSVFNAGRYAAFTRWFGGGDFGTRLPAASGVDGRSADFVVHVLGSTRPGRAIENDRQRSAYRYSPRYGPIPPCFSRGTVIQADSRGVQRILVAGTASVVGEDSCHTGDLPAQVAETCSNLAQLVLPELGRGAPSEALCRYSELRIYLVREQDAESVVGAFVRACPQVRRIEWMPADLCRPELLVEVEGLVEVSRSH